MLINQKTDRPSPNKRNNISFFDHLDVRRAFTEKDGIRYPRDSNLTDYGSNDYIDQYGDLKLFYKGYVGETLMTLFLSYNDTKTKYPIQVIDLRFQVDHINPKEIQIFEECRNVNPGNSRLFVILFRRREIELISDGNELVQVKVI